MTTNGRILVEGGKLLLNSGKLSNSEDCCCGCCCCERTFDMITEDGGAWPPDSFVELTGYFCCPEEVGDGSDPFVLEVCEDHTAQIDYYDWNTSAAWLYELKPILNGSVTTWNGTAYLRRGDTGSISLSKGDVLRIWYDNYDPGDTAKDYYSDDEPRQYDWDISSCVDCDDCDDPVTPDCDPCSDAHGWSITQEDAIITVSGSCADSDCTGAAGTYTFGYDAYGTCGWYWNKGYYTLLIQPDGSGGFEAIISTDDDIFEGPVTVTCDKVTRKLSVSGTLTGLNNLIDCSGCSATLTIG